jgi:hypothetical protein
MHFSKLKGRRARVFVGVLEYKKLGKLIPRIEGTSIIVSAIGRDDLTRLGWVEKLQRGRA